MLYLELKVCGKKSVKECLCNLEKNICIVCVAEKVCKKCVCVS